MKYLIVSLVTCLLLLTLWPTPLLVSAKEPQSNFAMIMGPGSTKYEVSGAGGIQITGPTNRWLVTSGTKRVVIDGSGLVAPRIKAMNEASDFQASVDGCYFVSQPAACTLPSAVGQAGREVIVCNRTNAGTVSYATTNGEKISGQESRRITNSTPCTIDRFISDGENWYKE